MNDSNSMLALELSIGIGVFLISTLIHIFRVLTNEKKKKKNQCEKKESAKFVINEDYEKVVLLTSKT